MTLIPNMRLIGLTSAQKGRDWDKLCRRIDHFLEQENYDLAEETVVLEFQNGEVSVMRQVIGGIKELPAPWILVDRVASEVALIKIDESDWDEVLSRVEEMRESLTRSGQKLREGCTILLKRRLGLELELSVEAFFSFF